ncbi:MAG: response regulator [Deltaproteobacteria bacterium]|nr:response regulator [Deltaproteobacteria bacterium]
MKVLLVDDDSDLRELFTEALRERGYHAEAVRSAEEALERLSREAFDVVACDMVMPGMNGIEMMKRIRRSCQGVLLIMITGDGAIETASKAIEAGAFGYMTKPFRFDEFLIILKNAAERLAIMSENSRLRYELQTAHAEMAALKKLSIFNGVEPLEGAQPLQAVESASRAGTCASEPSGERPFEEGHPAKGKRPTPYN